MKVGDKIKVNKECGIISLIGRTGILIECEEDYPFGYIVDFKDNKISFDSDEFDVLPDIFELWA